MIPEITAACKSATEHLLVAALDFCFYWRKRSINMGHTVWRLLKGFLLFKAYIEMSVSCVKLTMATLQLVPWIEAHVNIEHPNGNLYFFYYQMGWLIVAQLWVLYIGEREITIHLWTGFRKADCFFKPKILSMIITFPTKATRLYSNYVCTLSPLKHLILE